MLTPLQHRAAPSENKYFQELTVPTSMLFAVLAFGVGQPKRNPGYRLASAKALVGVVNTVIRSGKLQLTTRPVGSGQNLTVPVPVNGCLPQALLVVGALADVFHESWSTAAEARSAEHSEIGNLLDLQYRVSH